MSISPPSDDGPDGAQHDVVAFLSRGDCPAYRLALPGEVAPTRDTAPARIDTHSARLFVGEHIVCKMKRAIAYTYLDMTDVDTRRRLCERELEINRPVLPDVYLDTVAITRERDGTLSVNGEGEALEWVLRMRRFAQRDVFDEIAREHRLDETLARRLGAAIARYHETLPVAPSEDGHARALEVVDELDVELRGLGGILPQADAERFTAAARAALEHRRALLDRRAATGFVRRCHGDLHLRNILLRGGEPVPFDALEFDERLATTDVLYDLAFLVMDLGHRGLDEQQNVVLNEYLLQSAPDAFEGIALLPVFLAMRAAVRAMTTAQTVRAGERGERDPLVEEATSYLDAALAYLVPHRVRLIAVGGLSGSGKSTLASALPTRIASPPGAILLGSDAERKAALGLAPGDRIDPARYTPEAAAANYRRLLDKAGHALGGGFTVVLDATWLGAPERAALDALAAARDVPFAGLWLAAPAATLRGRIEGRREDISDATLAVLDAQLARDGDEVPPHWHRVDASGEAPATLHAALVALAALEQARRAARR